MLTTGQKCTQSGICRVSGFAFCRPVFACRTLGLVFLACLMLLTGGCELGEDEIDPLSFCLEHNPRSACRGLIDNPNAPTRANPVKLEFRTTPLPPPAESDNENYRTPEFMGHHALAAISADKAYQRGYFGQGATIAVADDGMDLTHPDLEGKIREPRHVVTGSGDVVETSVGHGTFVALISAAKRDNPGETFEIKIDGGAPIPTKNVHGVAPRASIMPLVLSGGGQPLDAIQYAVENQAHILNFSIGLSPLSFIYGKYAGREGVWLLSKTLPYFRPLLVENQCEHTSGLATEFLLVAEEIENEDIVLVWAAGNEDWNSFTGFSAPICGKNVIGEEGCELGEEFPTHQEFMENFEWIYNEDDPDRTCSFKDMWGTDCGSDSCVEYNSPGGWGEAPLFDSRLLGKWLVVVATDKEGKITDFSNGCGAARNWCLAAPGKDIAVHPGCGDGHPGCGISGTSFAAPMVSGALAVLKSRFPDMPMELIQSILLVSADRVCTGEGGQEERCEQRNEPDPVYGWGRLNLERAITLAGQVSLPYSVVPEPE